VCGLLSNIYYICKDPIKDIGQLWKNTAKIAVKSAVAIEGSLTSLVFPRGVIAVSDIITLFEDIGNQIPDKSWMLYLLEIFNKQNIPAELNLICSFNNDGKFDAIFNGVNQYQFKQHKKW
jgi:hypothetical protein